MNSFGSTGDFLFGHTNKCSILLTIFFFIPLYIYYGPTTVQRNVTIYAKAI